MNHPNTNPPYLDHQRSYQYHLNFFIKTTKTLIKIVSTFFNINKTFLKIPKPLPRLNLLPFSKNPKPARKRNTIKDIRVLYINNNDDYYETIKTKGLLNDNYVKLDSNGDRHKKVSGGGCPDEILPHLKNLVAFAL